MLYKCQNCKHEMEFGWLPPATCGLMLFYPLATACGYALVATLSIWTLLLLALRDWFGVVLPDGVTLTLFVVLFVPMLVFFVWLLWAIPASVEYLRVRRRPCPACGVRRWSRGYQRGFGL